MMRQSLPSPPSVDRHHDRQAAAAPRHSSGVDQGAQRFEASALAAQQRADHPTALSPQAAHRPIAR